MQWVWLLFCLRLLLLVRPGGFLHRPMQTGFRRGFQHVPHNCMRAERRQSARHRARQTTSTKRNHYVTYLFQGQKPEGCRVRHINGYVFYSQSKKHSNFELKQDERKSQSLTTAEALHTPISRTHASSGHPSSGGQPWTVTERLGLSPELALGEFGWKRDGATVTQSWGHLGTNTILDSTWLSVSLS